MHLNFLNICCHSHCFCMPTMCIIMPMKRIAVFLSDPQWAALRALAQKLGLSFSEVLRRAIDDYLRKHST